MMRKISLGVALAVLMVALAWALVPQLFTGYEPHVSIAPALEQPSGAHIFGTDQTGRDVFTRVIYAASNSLLAALCAVSIGFVGGGAIGLAAGACAGGRFNWVDEALMRLVEVLLAVPALLLSLSVVILLGFGTVPAAIAVGVTSVAVFARLLRARVLQVREMEFVAAAYGSGGTHARVLTRHVLPNALPPVVALAALQFGSAILQIATLGFLGYGPPPPAPEWGQMIAEGRNFVATAWWLTTLPALVLVAVVLATNRLSRALNDERQAVL